ncbi:MAG: prepilin-type N-terminal cleavage/methylation domain-containing protein [Candidatus Gracilibacteria bacterium]
MRKFVRNLVGVKGFTIMEMIVVLIVFGVILGLSVLYYQTTQVRADLNGQSASFVSYTRLAQSYAEAGKDGGNHGIHLESDRYVLFSGATYAEGAEGNFEIELPGTITIQNISLNGSGDDILFTAPHGETTTYGTLDFVSTQAGSNITITITQLGTIDY